MLPARAGMIPGFIRAVEVTHGAPRASGDDPGGLVLRRERGTCSPRERG